MVLVTTTSFSKWSGPSESISCLVQWLLHFLPPPPPYNHTPFLSNNHTQPCPCTYHTHTWLLDPPTTLPPTQTFKATLTKGLQIIYCFVGVFVVIIHIRQLFILACTHVWWLRPHNTLHFLREGARAIHNSPKREFTAGSHPYRDQDGTRLPLHAAGSQTQLSRSQSGG